MINNMKSYIGIKYYKDFRNKQIVDKITSVCKNNNIKTLCIIRDVENNGMIELTPIKLMKITFDEIDKCEFIIIEFSEKGVGLGIEAGYAYAKNIPIILIAKINSDISDTMKGIAKIIIFYDDINNIEHVLDQEIKRLFDDIRKQK
jgi:2'-deoxynucleoside 5'-phosphate N-hydrolase